MQEKGKEIMLIILDMSKTPWEAFAFPSLDVANDAAREIIKETGNKNLSIGEFIECWSYQINGAGVPSGD